MNKNEKMNLFSLILCLSPSHTSKDNLGVEESKHTAKAMKFATDIQGLCRTNPNNRRDPSDFSNSAIIRPEFPYGAHILRNGCYD